MASAIQYLIQNSSGAVIGTGASPDGTLPAHGVICTAAEAVAWQQCTVTGGVVTVGPAPAPTLAQQAAELIVGGIAITSAGSAAALNGTYSVSGAAQTNALGIVAYINANGKFPGSTATMTWEDSSGNPHVFQSPTEFLAFYSAALDFVTDCQDVIYGLSETLPSNAYTIP